MIGRLLTLIMKEFTQLRKNPALIRMLLLMPVMQMFIFGYAAVLDVKNIDTAVLDRDNSSYSRNFVDVFRRSDYFIVRYNLEHERDISAMLDREMIMTALVIPPDFSRKITSGRTAQVQIIVDGTNTSAASVIANYSAAAVASYSNRLLRERGTDLTQLGSLAVESRFLYNPSLDNKFFFIPGIFAMIILVIGMPITAMAIVREKEQGTLEQLIVTPIQSIELILGKVIPTTILIIISSTGILLLSLLWFHLPLRGSLVYLYGAILLFLLNCLGIGIFISTISNTQQQAILTSFFVNMPMILFSGFMFPIQNMPSYFRLLADINPMRYFLSCARTIFLKAAGWEALKWNFLAMAVIGTIIFTAAVLSFRKRID
jgi:ABC-2 type transport system permease protein